MSDSFRDWLAREIREVLVRPGGAPALLVWCDPERQWRDLLWACADAEGFELWAPREKEPESHELVLRDRFLAEPPRPRIVWLPRRRDELTWFKPFELEADQVWERSLRDGLRDYGVSIPRDHEDELDGLLAAQAREWFDKPRKTWDELTPGNAKGTLCSEDRLLQALAGPAGEFEALRHEGKFDVFARRVTEDYGLSDPRVLNETQWRIQSTLRLLWTEAAELTPQEPPRDRDYIIPRGLPRERSLKLLKRWQQDVQHIPSFETLAETAERQAGQSALGYWARNLNVPPRSRSSRGVEEVLFEQTANRLDRLEDLETLEAELEKLGPIVGDRQEGFWEKRATRKIGWRFVAEMSRAAGLLISHRTVETTWKTVEQAVGWYTDSGWELDHAAEGLYRESPELPAVLLRVRARLRRSFQRTLDRIGRAFSALLAATPERLEALPTAGEVLRDELAKEKMHTAILFVDACRFDLGMRLRDLLNEGEATRAIVKEAVAPLPSVTELAMAFTLPMPRKRLHVSLSESGKGFEVAAEGFSGNLSSSDQRKKWLKQELGVKESVDFNDVVEHEVKKPGRGTTIVTVHGKELDRHDGVLELTGAEDHLQRYAQAIRRLRDAGYTRVVLVTDHGFFHWQPEDHEIEDRLPEGEVLWKSRRAVVGHNLKHSTALCLSVPQSNLEVAVPRSISAFRTYGRLGFFHGGATLQELIVPVVIATWPPKTMKVGVVLKPVGHIASESPRVEVQATRTAGKRGGLFPESTLLSRRVIVRVVDPDGREVFRSKEAASIEPDGNVQTLALFRSEPRFDVSHNTLLTVEVVDADDNESLVRENAVLKIDLSEW